PAVAGMVASNAAIETDRLRCYAGLGAGGYRHHAIAKPERDKRSWLRTALSNARALIGGTHHGLGSDGRHLQAYLDEFAYRFNRRHRPDTIFDHCVAAVAACPPWTWREITGGVGFAKKAQPRTA
ncbi:MAG: transposase, partial [Patescibacteria group bacterium]